MGEFETYRKYNVNEVVLERESLHIMDDNRLIVIVDTRTRGVDDCHEQSVRYQIGNHIGSSSLELDQEDQIVSYEEYYPYGGTSYQARRSTCEVNLKRYRYVGKERDEETGLYYYGARYYAPWLGRWCSADKDPLKIGLHLYEYSNDSPVRYTDRDGRWEVDMHFLESTVS